MANEARLRALAPLLELLVESGDASLCDRLLLEAVLASGAARSAALWRLAEDGSWAETVSRGDPLPLPSRQVVEAVAQGRLRSELLPDRRVLVAREAGLAIALGGLSSREEDLDMVEALLLARVAVQSPSAPSDTWASPLPSSSLSKEVGEPRQLLHDLRNVLTSVRMTRDLLEGFSAGLHTDEAAHFRDVLERECRRIGELLGRAAGAEPFPRCAEPGLVVHDVADAERAGLAASRIRLVTRVDPAAADACVRLSEADLSRVVRNLIVNAGQVLTRGGGGRIAVALDCGDAGEVRLRIEDDGQGILPQAFPRLFEPGVSAGNPGGSGQGLAIVADLVCRAGGSVRAWNLPPGGESGAVFEVLLPRIGHEAPRDVAEPGIGA